MIDYFMMSDVLTECSTKASTVSTVPSGPHDGICIAISADPMSAMQRARTKVTLPMPPLTEDQKGAVKKPWTECWDEAVQVVEQAV